jgi:hypothetical protein
MSFKSFSLLFLRTKRNFFRGWKVLEKKRGGEHWLLVRRKLRQTWILKFFYKVSQYLLASFQSSYTITTCYWLRVTSNKTDFVLWEKAYSLRKGIPPFPPPALPPFYTATSSEKLSGEGGKMIRTLRKSNKKDKNDSYIYKRDRYAIVKLCKYVQLRLYSYTWWSKTINRLIHYIPPGILPQINSREERN